MKGNLTKSINSNYHLVKVVPSGLNDENLEMFLNSVHRILTRTKKEGTLAQDKKVKIGYFVLMTKTGVEYMFCIPTSIVSKAIKELRKAKFQRVELFSEELTQRYFDMLSKTPYYVFYTKEHNCFSLSTKNVALGRGSYNVKEDLEKENEFAIFSCEIDSIGVSRWAAVVEKFKKDIRRKPKNKLAKVNYSFQLSSIVASFINILSESFSMCSTKDKNDSIDKIELATLSEETKEKFKKQIFNTATTVISNSPDLEDIASRLLLDIRTNTSEDNEFTQLNKKSKGYKFGTGKKKSFLSSDELKSIISFVKEEDMKALEIEHVGYKEVSLPKGFHERVTNGDAKLFIGYNHYDGQMNLVYLDETEVSKGYMWCIIGRPGAGKTTFLCNLVASHALIKRPFIIIDDESDFKLSSKSLEVLDRLKVPYYHVDYTENIFPKAPIGSKRTTIKSVDFDFKADYDLRDETFDRIMERLEADAAGKIIILDSISSREDVSDNERLSNTDIERFKAISVLLKLRDKDTSLEDIIKFLEKKDKESVKELVEYIENAYGQLGKYNSSLAFALSLVQSDNQISPDAITRLRTNIHKIRSLITKGNPEIINFKKLVKEGIPIIVSLPENCTSEVRDTVSLYFYQRLFEALSEKDMMDSPVPCSVFIDEVYRFKAGLSFLHKEINRLRKRKIRFILTIHHIEHLNETKFMEDLKSDWCNISLFPNANEESFNMIAEKQGFSYERDMMEIKRLSINNEKYYMLNSLKLDANKTQNIILEAPKDLSLKENLDNLLEEIKHNKVIRPRKESELEKIIRLN